MTDLLDAVDTLTQPRIEHLAQRDDGGRWLRTHTVTHPPLLQRMHDAVHPSSNRSTGSASTASERSILDPVALYEYARMAAAVGDWCRIEGAQVTRDPVVDLRRWYVARLTSHHDDDDWYARTLRSWAGIIRTHLDPPETFTVDHPCPVCGYAGAWGDAINGGDAHPIQVRYRLTDDGHMTDETALCRLCATVWQGHDAVLELAEELDEKAG